MPRCRIVGAFLVLVLGAGCERGSAEDSAPAAPLLHIQGTTGQTHSGPRLRIGDGPGRILDQAVEAYGGLDRLKRWSKGHVKYRSCAEMLTQQGGDTVTIDEYFKFPGHFKRISERDVFGLPRTEVQIVNGQEGWLYSSGGSCLPLPPESIRSAQRGEHLFAGLCSIVPLRQPDTQLSVVGTTTLKGKKVLVLRSQKGSDPAVENYFDMDSALLVKLRRAMPDSASGRVQWMETELSDYKDIEGGPVPMHIVTRNKDKVLLDLTVLELSFTCPLDESIFNKP